MASFEEMQLPTPPRGEDAQADKWAMLPGPYLPQQPACAPPAEGASSSETSALRVAFSSWRIHHTQRCQWCTATMCGAFAQLGMAFDLWVKESARLRAQLETQRREAITAKSAATKAVAHLKARRKTPNRQRRRSGISSPSFSPAPPPSPPVYATPRPVETQPYYSHRHRQRPQYDRGMVAR